MLTVLSIEFRKRMFCGKFYKHPVTKTQLQINDLAVVFFALKHEQTKNRERIEHRPT